MASAISWSLMAWKPRTLPFIIYWWKVLRLASYNVFECYIPLACTLLTYWEFWSPPGDQAEIWHPLGWRSPCQGWQVMIHHPFPPLPILSNPDSVNLPRLRWSSTQVLKEICTKFHNTHIREASSWSGLNAILFLEGLLFAQHCTTAWQGITAII